MTRWGSLRTALKTGRVALGPKNVHQPWPLALNLQYAHVALTAAHASPRPVPSAAIGIAASNHEPCAAAAAASDAAAKPSGSPRALRTSTCLSRLRSFLPPHVHLRFAPRVHAAHDADCMRAASIAHAAPDARRSRAKAMKIALASEERPPFNVARAEPGLQIFFKFEKFVPTPH